MAKRSGGGGGHGDGQLRNRTPIQSANEFLQKKEECEKAINDFAATAGRGTLRQALDRVTFVDAGDLSDSELGQSLRDLGFPSWLSEAELNSKLGEHVGPFPSKEWKAIGLTNPTNHKVYLSSIWYVDHSIKDVDSVVVHEVLHDLFQGDHKKIAEALGLSAEGDEKAISDRIDAWLDGGCKSKKDK